MTCLKLKYVSVFFVLINVHVSHEVRGEGELNNFLRQIISEYGDWLQVGGHDPTPAMEEWNVISGGNALVSICCELGNTFAVGHSRDVTLLGDSVDSDLSQGYLNFYIKYGKNFTFKGDFKGNRTVVGNPLIGEGHWFISFGSYYQIVQFSGFSVTSDGFIDLSTASFYSGMWPLEYSDVTSYFEGLYDNVESQYKDMLMSMLEEDFKLLISDSYQQPLSLMIKTYVEEMFDKTPLSEIINTTLPPTNTAPQTSPFE